MVDFDLRILPSEDICRRVQHLFIVTDVAGEAIRSVNNLLECFFTTLTGYSSCDAALKVTILSTTGGGRTCIVEHRDIEDFSFEPLPATGEGDLGATFEVLAKRLCRRDLCSAEHCSYAPCLLLFCGGGGINPDCAGMEALKHNNWFSSAHRYAIPIGAVPNMPILEAFASKPENVLLPDMQANALDAVVAYLQKNHCDGGEQSW